MGHRGIDKIPLSIIGTAHKPDAVIVEEDNVTIGRDDPDPLVRDFYSILTAYEELLSLKNKKKTLGSSLFHVGSASSIFPAMR